MISVLVNIVFKANKVLTKRYILLELPKISTNSLFFSFTLKKLSVKVSIITKIKLASFGKFILDNKNLTQSSNEFSLCFIFILFIKDFNTSPFSLGGFSFAKNSPIKYLSNPLTTSKNSPNSLAEFIISDDKRVS